MEQERGAFKVNRETRSRMAQNRSVCGPTGRFSHVAMQKIAWLNLVQLAIFAHYANSLLSKYTFFRSKY
jgi:hypothetical protein